MTTTGRVPGSLPRFPIPVAPPLPHKRRPPHDGKFPPNAMDTERARRAEWRMVDRAVGREHRGCAPVCRSTTGEGIV